MDSKKFQQNRSANAIFLGLVSGFTFSLLLAFCGFKIEDYQMNNSTSDFLIKSRQLETPLKISVAEFLHHEVRVLCFILPMSKHSVQNHAEIFLKTWTKRCQKIIFFTDEPDDRFADNIVVLQYKDNNLARLGEALSYIYKHHLNDFDWILKANDNSYIIMENLRWLLYQYETDWPLIIGQRVMEDNYIIGTYAISKRAFTRLIENGLSNSEMCGFSNFNNEDKEISKCFRRLNVIQVNAVDCEGKSLFFRNTPEFSLITEKIDPELDKAWSKMFKEDSSISSAHGVSDRMIAVQNVWNTHLYYMEYYIYKVHAFGRHRLPEPLPRKKSLEEVVKNFNKK